MNVTMNVFYFQNAIYPSAEKKWRRFVEETLLIFPVK